MARPKEVSDAQILQAARSVFLEHGTQAPVSLVAKALGVSTATIFVRMGTKIRLISSAFWPADPPVLALLEDPKVDTQSLEGQWINVVLDLAAWADRAILATFTLYSAGLRPKSSEDFEDVVTPARLRRALARRLRDAVKAGTVDCEPRMAADVILSTVEAHAMHTLLGKRPLTARARRKFAHSLVHSALRPKASAE